MQKPTLSIVIVNYNTRELTGNCLRSLETVENEVNFEIILVDNGSTDGSAEMVAKDFPRVKLITCKTNLGFGRANNLARKVCGGEFVLFLNSDTIVPDGVLSKLVNYLKEKENIGAISCKLVLPDGTVDRDTRRSFPTPWVALTHLSGIDRLFPSSRLFARYWYGFIPVDRMHEVDVLQGAFFLTRRKILNKVGWFDEAYYLDGEDIDLSWRIHELGFSLMYFPEVSITHIKGATKGKNKLLKLGKKERLRFVLAGVESMEIFYKKHLNKRYPRVVNWIVFAGINLVKITRTLKVILVR